MIHAKAFLINTDMNLDEISIAIGYNSVDHFIRNFYATKMVLHLVSIENII